MVVVNKKLNGVTGSWRTIALVLFTVLITNTVLAIQPIPDISQTPLELTPTVAPNVMILFDDSGSMDFEIMTADAVSSGLFFAPHPDGTGFGSTDASLQIKHRPGCELIAAAFGGYAYGTAAPTNHYVDSSGSNCYVAASDAWRFRSAAFNRLYFDPMQTYEPWAGFRPAAGGGSEEFPDIDITLPAPFDPFDPTAGSIDLFATTPDPVVGDFRYYDWQDLNADGLFQEGEQTEVLVKNEPDEVKQKFANWFSYHRSRHLRAKALLGKLIEDQTGTQIGLVRFNFSNLPSLPVEAMNADAEVDEKRILLDALYSTKPEQLATLFEERSPLHKRYIETARYLACSSSNVFSGSPDCPAEAPPAGSCQANHIVVASDAFSDRFPFISPFNGGNNLGIGDEDSNNDTDFDGGVFADDPDAANTFISFFTTFSDVAMRFYEDDIQTSIPDEVPVEEVDETRYPTSTPTLDSDDTLHQHIKTHAITFTLPFTGDPTVFNLQPPLGLATEPFLWQSPYDSDFDLLRDLVHAVYSGRGEYIDATDTTTTQVENLTQTVGNGIGSTTPVAINTQTAEQSAVLYRTFYDATSNSGDLVAQQIGPDGIPEENSGEPVFQWSAAEQLDVQIGENGANFLTQRNIITYSDNSGIGEALRFTYDVGSGIDAIQQGLLDLPTITTPLTSPTLGETRLNYLRGDTSNEGTNFNDGEFRIRPETTSTGGGVTHFAKLGTIANAAPVFVGAPMAIGRFGGAWPSASGQTYFDFQTAQEDRDPSVLAAANDGMFHVFDADNGNERFAYVPELVFDQLSKLTDPEYKHQFYVDATPSVNDAYIRASASAGSPTWNTIVIGGLGAGGSGYYAINITDPGNFNDEDSARTQVMWEFGPEDDPDATGPADSDLGLSFGRPLIAMSNASDASGNRRWVAVFGNGYNSTSASGNAVIYMLFIDEGLDGIWNATDLVKIDTGIGGAVGPFTNPNGIADVRGIDADGDGTIDRLYAGDLRGNLHVVNIESSDPNDWDSASNRFILFNAIYQPTGDTQPITTLPVALRHPTGTGFLVVFATGSYFTRGDATDTAIQSIYGVWDDQSNSSVSASTLVEQTLSNGTFTRDDGTVIGVRTVSDNPVTWGTPGGNNADRGWFINFNVPPQGSSSGVQFPGEKAIRALQLRGSVLFVNTVIPQISSCEPAPGGFGLGLDPLTGSDGSEIIFDINIDNIFDSKDNITVGSDLKIVVGTRFESTPSDSSFFGNYRITQLANTDIDTILTNTGGSEFLGRQSWREVEF